MIATRDSTTRTRVRSSLRGKRLISLVGRCDPLDAQDVPIGFRPGHLCVVPPVPIVFHAARKCSRNDGEDLGQNTAAVALSCRDTLEMLTPASSSSSPPSPMPPLHPTASCAFRTRHRRARSPPSPAADGSYPASLALAFPRNPLTRHHRPRRSAAGYGVRILTSPDSSVVLRGWLDGWGGGSGRQSGGGDGRKSSPGVGRGKGQGQGQGKGDKHKSGKDAKEKGSKKMDRVGGVGGSRRYGQSRDGVGRGAKAGDGKGKGTNRRDPVDISESSRGLVYAVADSLTSTIDGFQERLSQAFPSNVTLMWGGGEATNVTVPWRGIGLYAGGLVSGLAVSFALLTLPYGELGSPGLRKSLTLFENVLLDIDQGYVEEVDTERLLETAVVSMLRTLDPYTEFQNNQAAADLKESVSGRYGGVGLVIAGGKQQRQPAGDRAKDEGVTKRKDEGSQQKAPGIGAAEKDRRGDRVNERDGITVVSAFEGYAFDAGMRAGDRITAINGQPVTGISVDKARDLLRGEPNSKVSISFIRDGANLNEQEITLTRRLVKLRDVKLAALVGDVKTAPVGYLQLSGFSKGAAQELEQAYRYLDSSAVGGLRGVILDLRGNPGGLLESAVDVSALFVPQGSSIVSIKGRNFQDITYGSSQGPVRPNSTPLVVLTNAGTASAAEIVSGAVQDLDAGVIVGVGDGRTYGKGLVQNIAELPYNNALKYTVAKYYTPSGRCIQSINYKEGGVAIGDQPATLSSGGNAFGYEASEVPELERKEFITKHGRVVFDGGGVEADVKVKLPKPSALEVALQVQGAYFDFAGQWTRTHSFKGVSDVATDSVLQDFRNFVLDRQREGMYDLASIYAPQLRSLDSVLEASNLNNYETLTKPLSKQLTQEMVRTFDSRKEQIRASLEEAILSRYLPESMVLRKALDKDPQFLAGLELVRDQDMYRRIITPADAKLTEDVLRSFGQALKESVQQGDLKLLLGPSEDRAEVRSRPKQTATASRLAARSVIC